MTLDRNLTLVLLVTLIGTIGIALPYPVLSPLFLNSDNQVNQFWELNPYWLLGLSLAVYPAGLLIGGNMLGKLSDRLGRKPVLMHSLYAAAFANLLCAASLMIESFPVFVITRLLTGLLEGNISVARAVITDLDEHKNKTIAFSYLSAAGYAGWFLGPLMGGYTTFLGYATPFVLAFVMNLAAAILLMVHFQETLQHKTKVTAKNTLFWRAPYLPAFLLVQFLLTLAVNIFYEFASVHLVILWNTTPMTIANANMACTFAMMLSSVFLVPGLLKRLSQATIYFYGTILTGSSFIILSLPDELNFAVALFAVCGLSIALYNGVAYAWFSDRFPHLAQGRLMGVLVATFCLANIIAAVLGSWMSQLSTSLLLQTAGVLAIISGLLFILFNRAAQITEYQLTAFEKP